MLILTPSADLLRPFQLEDSNIRGRFVRLADTVDRVLKAHDYPVPVKRLLGELLVLAGGLAGGLKFDGSFSLQMRGAGPVTLMVADCTNDGRMRGYASFDADLVDEEGDPSPERLLGAKGLLALTVDQTKSGGETYQGIVELSGDSLADSMLTYFRQSEQVPTGIRMALTFDDATQSWRAGAIIMQAMPDAEPLLFDEREVWQEAMILLETATDEELVDPALAPDTLLFRLFHERGVRVFEALALANSCSCDEGRVSRMLRSFGLDDIEEMRLPDGSVEVTCQFCNERYRFDRAALHAMFKDKRH